MAAASSLLLPREPRIYPKNGYLIQPKSTMDKGLLISVSTTLSSHYSQKDSWSLHLLNSAYGPSSLRPRCRVCVCRALLKPGGGNEIPVLKTVSTILMRSYGALHGNSVVLQLIPALGIIAFTAWGLGPLLRLGRTLFLHKTDNSWHRSGTHHFLTAYLQPVLLWAGATLVCRALDPVILPSVASQAVKQRILNFVRSLSTVMAFAYCLSSLIQQTQKFFSEVKDSSDARNMSFEFAGKAVYTAVWVAALSLFMELLGFSTQKWLTAGGLGTVLLTLAGREIFTNFLSSIMIHATRPFILNDWIQTKIEGYEVSGTVEHVGWWSPTVIRGDDREAVHIPNHKFTVTVVRNLSQKTHWRIKTHLAISHLDVNKINNIVADMRKVIAKTPQIEQQKLHRRVFLDNVDPENQALRIMVSCFVKTSRFEEYLCVKEAVLLDLLRVISHHRARLATPIRTVQKFYREAIVEDVPFPETVFNGAQSTTDHRPLLLIEPSYKINNTTRSTQSNEVKDKDSKVDHPPVSDAKTGPSSNIDEEKKDNKVSDANSKLKGGTIPLSEAKVPSNSPGPIHEELTSNKNPNKQPDSERSIPSRPVLEENMVLGVALEGSKRTLPIEEDMPSSPNLPESKELAGTRNGNGSTSDTKDDQGSSGALSDQRDK